jgi:D12 class N6 adenine-specific DNA methyltransferase
MALPLTRLKTIWQASTAGTEDTLHQLAPYIGKLKTSIASTILSAFSKPGDVVFDPFCGSGVVPLEALLLGRGAIANDLNPYAAALTRAKLFPIESKDEAIATASRYVEKAKRQAKRTGYQIDAPLWVKQFFHPKTLSEAKILADLLQQDNQWFLLANLLGILHHQRPGFLSFPASHLVPYLRATKFPSARFPHLYKYRDVARRLSRKLDRTYRRHRPFCEDLPRVFTQRDVRRSGFRIKADIAVTSPPYMNALDYGRDNRLRLWFLGYEEADRLDQVGPNNIVAFADLMRLTAHFLRNVVRRRGVAVLIVGEIRRGSNVIKSNTITKSVFTKCEGGWGLIDEVADPVPDIRRSRRTCAATKSESIMVFERK